MITTSAGKSSKYVFYSSSTRVRWESESKSSEESLIALLFQNSSLQKRYAVGTGGSLTPSFKEAYVVLKVQVSVSDCLLLRSQSNECGDVSSVDHSSKTPPYGCSGAHWARFGRRVHRLVGPEE